MPPELCALLLSGLLAAGADPARTAPDMEMLEFLGTYETQGGQWLDPQTLPDNPEPEKSETGARGDTP